MLLTKYLRCRLKKRNLESDSQKNGGRTMMAEAFGNLAQTKLAKELPMPLWIQ